VLLARFSSRALICALCLLTAAFCPLARAALELGYSAQIIQTEQGLPQNNINSIIQSNDGYLWLATFGGLVRYDGVRFKVFDSANTPQLQNSRITALFEDGNQIIWIGHETGDLTRLGAGRFESVAIPGSAHREPVSQITMDRQGNMIVCYQDGSLRDAQTGAWIEASVAPDPQRGPAICARDDEGALWVLRFGALSRVVGAKTQSVELNRFAADQLVSGICRAREGGVWIATQGQIRRRVRDEWVGETHIIFWPRTTITALVEMNNGTLAVATIDQGIYLLRPNARPYHFERKDGLPSDWIRTLSDDREGNLWAALGSGGLAVLRRDRVKPVASEDRWKGRTVRSVAATSKNQIWAGTEGAGLYRYVQEYSRERFIPTTADRAPTTNSFVWSFAEDTDQRLWISTAENGLFQLAGDKFQPPPGLEDFLTPVRALHGSRAQRAVFLGSRSGLLKYENQKLLSLGTNLIGADVRCIVESTNGVIWFGMFGGGLGKLENGKATQFRKADGLSSDFVQCLYLDETDGALWIGTAESGLNRFKNGKFTTITAANGLRDQVICHIADDGLGNVWMTSQSGIMRVAKAGLNECADGKLKRVRCLTLGETDGLPTSQCSGGLQPTGAKTADGILWFATLKGIVAIDPTNVRTNQPPLPLAEELRVNDVPVALKRGAAPSAIPSGRHRYDFDFTAISFAAPERVLFKYRLAGLEDEWTGPTTKRTVSYSHLPPGDYRFEVSACNSDDVWAEAAKPIRFTVLPLFWQTMWFRILAVLAAIALVGLAALLITRQRYRRRLELAERQRGIERERSRIAQDIHDDLGSSLTRIILLSQSARGDLDSPDVAAKDLDRIYDTARNLTRSLDEIVWAVNPRHDTLDSLATYLGKFAQDFLNAANIRCRLDLPVSVPSWPLTAEVRHNVFLAFKEALNNAVKHANATEVRVSLNLQPAAFKLIVEDNGRGFSPPQSAPDATNTEDGLQNMRKRLVEVGGSCEIYSQPNKGTRITFQVPVAPESQ
jgi:signal transduction histidine kinase/ligand-binding sensor domain-containing protein